MKRIFGILATVYVLTANAADDYDVVILNGRVMDPETMFDAVRNVGIKDGLIATITKDRIKGSETINARGHVVAAGFIDTHHHGAGNLWGMKVGLRDGVTTPMDLELGTINGQWPILLKPFFSSGKNIKEGHLVSSCHFLNSVGVQLKVFIRCCTIRKVV